MENRPSRAAIRRILTDALLPLYDNQEAAQLSLEVMLWAGSFDKVHYRLVAEASPGLREWQRLQNARQRMIKGAPLQYITGATNFCGLRLRVDPDVLIPRPETEELVAWIAGDFRDKTPAIADLCAGSGCIALALKARLPGATVQTLEISEEALYTLQVNAARLHLPISAHRGDALADTWPLSPLDILVSNPPYIPTNAAAEIGQNVLGHEPGIALLVPHNDPLLFYRAMATTGKQYLKPGGSIYFEVHENFAKPVHDLVLNLGYSKAELRNDIQGKPRMIKAQWDG